MSFDASRENSSNKLISSHYELFSVAKENENRLQSLKHTYDQLSLINRTNTLLIFSDNSLSYAEGSSLYVSKHPEGYFYFVTNTPDNVPLKNIHYFVFQPVNVYW